MKLRVRRFVIGSLIFLITLAIHLSAKAIVFSTGSLIIPMDIDPAGQDNGMLRAYGLVYELLRHRVPVYWVINSTKVANGNDFSISLANQVQDVRTGATVATPRSYRGGPFVIASADVATALPIIQTWQATASDVTTVHRLTAGGYDLPVARTLISAPRLAVLKDGNETIAFNNLNAAGITDAVGATWTASSPDVLTEADVAGPTISNQKDGALFLNGLPRYSCLISMHYNATATTPEVVAETRNWLATSALTHLYAQCASVLVFENATAGLLLSTNGLIDDGSPIASPANRLPASPSTQMDGTFQTDSGTVDSIGLAASSIFKTGVTTLINDSTASLLQHIVMLTGRMDGNSLNGRVTYLAGHDYDVTLPISANPQANGIRLFLNSLLASDSATTVGQSVNITMTAPASVNTSTITYTITCQNSNPRSVENLRLTDKLSNGATYVNGSASITPFSTSSGSVTWNLPTLAPNGSTTLTFQVSVTSDGTYQNNAQLRYSDLTWNIVAPNTAVTVRDTVPPTVTIASPPTNPTATTNPTPSFVFSGDASVLVFNARVDADAFVPAMSPFTTRSLADGTHTFYVSASDVAGNTATANFVFVVDTAAPVISIPLPPNHDVTANPRPSFTFSDTSPAGTSVAFDGKIDSGSFAPVTSPYTVGTPLSPGAHALTVRGTDAVGHTGQATFNFIVSTPPVLNIVPAGAGAVSVSWLPTFSGCTLEQSLGLSPTNWVDVPSHSLDPVTISTSIQPLFFRVRAP